ncbi:MAG: hypothetical protein ABW146_03105 [Candidatus Sedimenticola sp. 6PFRAG7]
MAGNFVVGARGWEHEGWCGSFYPEDLPPEWRLTYYANEFRSVLLPADRWIDADEEVIGSWCDDVHEAFSFFLELPGEGDAPDDLPGRLLSIASIMDGVLAGVLWTGTDDVPQSLKGQCADDIVFYRPSVLARDQGGVRAFGCCAGQDADSVDLLLLDGASCADLRELRRLFESSGLGHGACASGVFVDGEVVDAERMHQMETLAQLLGIT